MHKDDLYFIHGEKKIGQWCPDTACRRKIFDVGKAINGVNTGPLAGIACHKDGSLLVTDPSNNRIVCTRDGVSSVIGEDVWNLFKPFSVKVFSHDGTFVLDRPPGMFRVHKLRNGVASVVVQWKHEGKAEKEAISLHVTDDEAIYVSMHDRVLRWAPGATAGIIVAGGNGRGSGVN